MGAAVEAGRPCLGRERARYPCIWELEYEFDVSISYIVRLCLPVFSLVGFFETGFLSVALAVLELNFVVQDGLRLGDLPASASQALELKAWAARPKEGRGLLVKII